ncbi:putative chromatin regulator PHD family [Helianthus anomalus]
MVSGWRRVFCTSIRTDSDQTAIEDVEHAHHFTNNRLGFSSSSSSKPSTPRLRCRTTATPSPEINKYLNTPPPCSPSSFSLLKSSLRFRTRRCGICLQSVKKGSGTASFTAECSHAFHFPCVSDYVTTQGSLACPVCSSLWKEMPLLTVEDRNHKVYNEEQNSREKLSTRIIDDVDSKEHQNHQHKRPDFKVYNDDEPLAVLTPKSRFNPIPESDEDFQSESFVNCYRRDVEVRMSPETVAITASGRHLTYGIILNVKAPAPEKLLRRAPIDLVVVADVSGKLRNENIQIMKKAMRTIISSLSSSDRLSIVAFSSHSKRLLPLRRMTTTGRRAVRCIVEAMTVLTGCSNANDAVKKAVKVLQDRREKNPVAAVILFSVDGCSHSKFNIPVHLFNLAVADAEEHVIEKLIGKVLNVAVQDLRLELELVSGGSPAVITAVYCRRPQPIVLGSSSVEIGELSANEERELLVEIKLPLSTARAHRVLSVQCCYRELFTQEIIYGQQQSLVVPGPTTVRSCSASPTIQRLRNIFISTSALAESRRLTEGNDIAGACNVLVSARALMKQSLDGGDELVVGLEAELTELQRRRKVQAQAQEVGKRGRVGVMRPVVYAYTDEKGEALTPTSAWRMADKLAKAAMMRKSVNRVSDLHGFEDARF